MNWDEVERRLETLEAQQSISLTAPKFTVNNADLVLTLNKTGTTGNHAYFNAITAATSNPAAYSRYDAPGMTGTPYWQAGIYDIGGPGNYTICYKGTPMVTVTSAGIVIVNMSGIGNYGSNAAAVAGGLPIGAHYRNGDYLCVVHA